MSARGEDLAEWIKRDRISRNVRASNSSETVADAWLSKVGKKPIGGHDEKRRWLLTFINAAIGKRPIASTSAQELRQMQRKTGSKCWHETAKRLRDTCSQPVTKIFCSG